MNNKEKFEYLENGTITREENIAYCKVSAMLAIKNDSLQDASDYLNEWIRLSNTSTNSMDQNKVSPEVIKQAIQKLDNSGIQRSIDGVIDQIDPNLKSDNVLRQQVQEFLN